MNYPNDIDKNTVIPRKDEYFFHDRYVGNILMKPRLLWFWSIVFFNNLFSSLLILFVFVFVFLFLGISDFGLRVLLKVSTRIIHFIHFIHFIRETGPSREEGVGGGCYIPPMSLSIGNFWKVKNYFFCLFGIYALQFIVGKF